MNGGSVVDLRLYGQPLLEPLQGGKNQKVQGSPLNPSGGLSRQSEKEFQSDARVYGHPDMRNVKGGETAVETT